MARLGVIVGFCFLCFVLSDKLMVWVALGSMTGPAALQGLFGNRISTGVMRLDGVMPITEWVSISLWLSGATNAC